MLRAAQKLKTIIAVALTASAWSTSTSSAGLLLRAQGPASPVDVSGGAVHVSIPLFIQQTDETDVISGLGLYSVGASILKLSGEADIAAASRYASNFTEPDDENGLSTVTFSPTDALFKVLREDLSGIASVTGELQFATLNLFIPAVGGTSSFALTDNDVSPGVDDTLDANLEGLDSQLTGSTFSITAVVPEPTSLTGLALLAMLAMRRQRASLSI